MYKGIALSFIVYEQQGRDKDLPAYLAEISVGGFDALEMRVDKFFGSKAAAEAASVALRVDNQKMYTGLVEAELDDGTRAAQTSMAVVAAAERAVARDLDFRGVVLVPLAGGRPRDDAAVDASIARIQQLGSSLSRRGAWLALHNDAVESADGCRILRRMLDATAGDANIGLALDVAWCQRGGGDAAAIAAAYKDRLKTLHLRQTRDGVWSEELGDGDIDLRAVDKVARPLKHEVLLVVELNHEAETRQTRRQVDDLKLSRQYLRKVFTV